MHPLCFYCMKAADFLLTREIRYNTPKEASETISAVFPEETSGSGIPVGGILPLTTSALTIVCKPYVSVMPEASRKEKKSCAEAAIFIPRKIINAHSANNKTMPTNPTSSPITARIKSLSAKGRNLYFCRERKIPVPNQPPLPSAYSD